jgi:hypothetical protein
MAHMRRPGRQTRAGAEIGESAGLLGNETSSSSRFGSEKALVVSVLYFGFAVSVIAR